MSIRVTGAVLAALLTAMASAGPGTGGEIARIPSGGGVYSLALAGSDTVWTTFRTVQSARDGHVRTIWQAHDVAIPPDIRRHEGYDARLPHGVPIVAGSAKLVAIVVTAALYEMPHCAPRCLAPGYFTPLWAQLLVKPRGRPFFRLEGDLQPCRRPQWLVQKVDVWGSSAIVSETSRKCGNERTQLPPSRVVLIDGIGHRLTRRVLAVSNRSFFDDVSLAGRFASWEARRTVDSIVTVYDRSRRRVSYRATAPRGSRGDVESDLSADGTIVAVSEPTVRCGYGVLLASRAHPSFRRVSVGAGLRVRIVGRSVAFIGRPSCRDGVSQLVVERLGGRTTTFPGEPGNPAPIADQFDFDGTNVAYASRVTGADRKVATAIVRDRVPTDPGWMCIARGCRRD
jgi:hypothetical protein